MAARVRTGLALAAVLSLLACAATPDATEPEIRDTGELLMWEVHGAGPGRAHLLGSVHLGTGEDFDPAIRDALAEADALVLEVSGQELDAARMGALLIERALLGGGRTLADVLPADVYAAVEDRYADRSLEWQGLRVMEPWVLLISLGAEGFTSQGLTGEGGVEHRLLEAAGDRPVLGLETIDEQLALFDELPSEVVVEAIRELVEPAHAEQTRRLGASLIRAWEAGDAGALETLLFADLGRDPAIDRYYEAFFFERNEHMAERLDALLRAPGEYFVAVGAGHVVGERGVPALLAERGWRLERVPRAKPTAP